MHKRNNQKVLFIDDDAFFSIGYIDALDCDYRVTVARDAVAAECELDCSHHYDCAILDIMMPVPASWPLSDQIDAGNGLHTGIIILRRCRQAIIDSNLPVVVLTNRNTGEIEGLVKRFGFPDGMVEVHHKSTTSAGMIVPIIRGIIDRVCSSS